MSCKLLKITISALLAVASFQSFAQEDSKRLALNLDWGYCAGVFEHSHANYTAAKGYRQDERSSGFAYWSNAYVLCGVGVDAGARSTFSFLTGYAGITSYRNVVPFLVRYSWHKNGRLHPGFTLHAEAGPAIGGKNHAEGKGLAWLGSLNFGYSYPLLDSFRLEFTGGLRYTCDHPAVVDASTGQPVSSGNLRRSNAGHLSLCIGVALAF